MTGNRGHDGGTQSKDREGGRAVALGCVTGEDVLHTMWEHIHTYIQLEFTQLASNYGIVSVHIRI